MASLDDGLTAGTAGTEGKVSAVRITGITTGVATGVAGAGAGRKAAVGAKSTSNSAAAMGTTADAGTALPADATGAAGSAGTGTDTVVKRNGTGSAGDPRATYTSTFTAAMVGTTNAGTARTMGTASQEEYPDETQAITSLTAPKENLAKELDKTPLYEQIRLEDDIHALHLQDSPNLTHLNDAENKPAVGIMNIPKSSTIRVLHSFGVGTNPI